MAKQYKGSLSLEWFNKQKAIISLAENSIKSDGDIPAPLINWINKDEALFYELNQSEGKGNIPYWVNREDIRVKEARPLIFQKAFRAVEKDKKGTLPGTSTEFVVEEITNEEDALDIENLLIKGDNLIALNTLKKHFDKLSNREKVKCIYIDPPYNTGSAFEQYDDNLAHSEWLSLMRDRLVILKSILRDDGLIYIQIDDKEYAYLKILMDEIFGRDNFVTTLVVQMSYVSGEKMAFKHKKPPKIKEYILMYANDYPSYEIKPRYVTKQISTEYNKLILKNKSEDHTTWEVVNLYAHLADLGIEDEDEIRNFILENAASIFNRVRNKTEAFMSTKGIMYPTPVTTPTGLKKWAWNGREVIFLSNRLEADSNGRMNYVEALGDIWNDINITNLYQEGNVDFKNGKKQEELVRRIFEMSSEENDIVLDCFGGSGTSFAVATKINRKWIGVELGNHAETHIISRLKNVLAGNDNNGISESVKWLGGGSFKYYHLGESIINVDTETGKGEFNWTLGKQFIQESLLASYDFVLQKDIDVFPAKIFKDTSAPTIGKLSGKNHKSIYGLSFLASPGEMEVTISNDEIKAIYNVIRKQSDFHALVIYTNKGIDIAQDAMPVDMDIIKVPHAIFAELER